MHLSIQAINHTLPYFSSCAVIVPNKITTIFKNSFLETSFLALIASTHSLREAGEVFFPTYMSFSFKGRTEELKKGNETQKEIAFRQEYIEPLVREYATSISYKNANKINVRMSDSVHCVGYDGSYKGPILNLKWYGHYLDSKGELNALAKGVIGHELTHLEERHSLMLLLLSTINRLAAIVLFASTKFLLTTLAIPSAPTVGIALLTTYTVYKVFEKLIICSYRRHQEWRADFAVLRRIPDCKEAHQVATAMKLYYQEAHGYTLEHRKKLLSSNSLLDRLSAWKIRPDGTKLFSTHPNSAERARYFENEEKRLAALLPPEKTSWKQAISNKTGKFQLGW